MDFKSDFLQRIKAIRTTRWIRFGIVSVLFFLWVAWLGTWWVALFIFLLFDIYITGYIPLTWWKKSKSSAVKAVMSWVDAIVYALVLVYFVFSFIGQNYQIPSSSLEKTLLTGDYLWVNKLAYGPRVPMTPVHFPLSHNTLPVLNVKSYLDKPSLKYHRLKGYKKIEAGDIVVFNFPAGDTVALKVQNPDYYTLVKLYGRDMVKRDKQQFGEIVYRPVDRRENYVKRCVGLPGQRIRIVDGTIYIDGQAQKQPENVQFNYFFQTKMPLSDAEWDELGIAADDRNQLAIPPSSIGGILGSGFQINPDGSIPPIYLTPLTNEMAEKLKSSGNLINLMKMPVEYNEFLFPDGLSQNWTHENYGGEEGLLIPQKGMTVGLNPESWATYSRCIRNYENNDAELHGDTIYINGEIATEYTFQMDYYFMMGDNRDNSLDSRYWGFVPEDHIVGTPMFVLISFDKDKRLFDGGIRWKRIFKDANPDK